MSKSLQRERDFGQFLKILWRKGRPDYLPFFELLASPGFIARRTGTRFDEMSPDDAGYWRIYVDFWYGMGYDCVPMEVPLNCPLPEAAHSHSIGSESRVVIQTTEDYEKYQWPDESAPIDFSYFEQVAALLPEGVKIIGGAGGGPYEWLTYMMGTVGLSYALADNPELVEMMLKRLGNLHCSAVRQLASMEAIGALRQGDDLGFKTSTFLSPKFLRQHVFPIYKTMASESHEAGKPFILHSCGNLSEVYEDLIEYCKIDAKHSFEDGILPVSEFKKQYGDRITPLGGLDVDVICRGTEEEVRAYARKQVEACFYDDYWALGTGNSLADYMPVGNYIAVLEEGLSVTA